MLDSATAHRMQLQSRNALAEAADECCCPACQASSPNTSGPRVLSEVVPFPDESLTGLIARVSGRNHQARLRTVLSAATQTWHVHYNLAVRDDIGFDQLAFACRLAPHEVESRRYRPAELSPKLPGVRYHGAVIPAYDLALRACRTCPAWARAGYHSALGHHGLVTHCPISGEVLVDRCPRCSRKYAWTRSAIHTCHLCGLNLADYQGLVVSERARDASSLLINLVHPHPQHHSRAFEKLHPSLAGADRGTVFELGWRMGCAFSGRGMGARDAAVNLPLTTKLRIFAKGSKALAEWPASFERALKGLRSSASDREAALAENVLLIASSQNSWPALRELIRSARPGLGLSRQKALKFGLVKGANSGELQKVLGVSQRVVDRLRSAAQLTAVRTSGTVNSHQIFEASGLAELESIFKDHVSVGAIAERLDISSHGVEQLACLGKIEIFDQEAARAAFVRRQARQSDYDRLVRDLNAVGAVPPEGGRGGSEASLSMHMAMKVVGGREKPWGPVILAMLSGELPFELDLARNERFMCRVRIAEANLPKLENMRFDQEHFPAFRFETYINGRDAEELLNIYPKVMQAAKQDKVIPKAENGLYDRNVIQDLAKRFMSAAEILAKAGYGSRSMPTPFKGRGAPRKVSALGWDRKEAEKLLSTCMSGKPASS